MPHMRETYPRMMQKTSYEGAIPHMSSYEVLSVLEKVWQPKGVQGSKAKAHGGSMRFARNFWLNPGFSFGK